MSWTVYVRLLMSKEGLVKSKYKMPTTNRLEMNDWRTSGR